MHATLHQSGHVLFTATSDSELTRGLAGVLVEALSGLTAQEILELDPSFLPQLGLGGAIMAPSRANGFANMLEAMKRRTRMLIADLPKFPSLVISADSILPQGTFAEAQAQYLEPNAQQVDRIAGLLQEKKIGVVAHFYMDPQVQGVLSAAAERWPHIHISDSLVMADAAVSMAAAGCTTVAVLGVDFMSENVRAILDEAGYQHVKVRSAILPCLLWLDDTALVVLLDVLLVSQFACTGLGVACRALACYSHCQSAYAFACWPDTPSNMSCNVITGTVAHT